MRNVFGNAVTVTLFGESHGKAVGAVLDGIAPGVRMDRDYIERKLALRRPEGAYATGRRERDDFEILSGVYNGKTTGAPVVILIPNGDVRSEDYEALRGVARPGHADYAAHERYNGFEDPRGGGRFSGRLTAPLTAAGAIAQSILEQKGIFVGTHIAQLGKIADRPFSEYEREIAELSAKHFAALDDGAAAAMKEEIAAAAAEGDSVGGVLECAAIGLPAGIGEPFFDGLESMLSHALFSIPGVKGVEFGGGFGLCCGRGGDFNDAFALDGGRVVTTTNRSGGLNGGLTNGMPVLFRVAVRPTPSIGREQKTVDFINMKETVLKIGGRHDASILPRARAVVDAMTALVLLDALTMRFGTEGQIND